MGSIVELPKPKTTLEAQREMRFQGKRGNVVVSVSKERDALIPWRKWYVVKVVYWRFNDPREPEEVVHRLSMRGLVSEIVVGAQETAIREHALFDFVNETGEPDEYFLYLTRKVKEVRGGR